MDDIGQVRIFLAGRTPRCRRGGVECGWGAWVVGWVGVTQGVVERRREVETGGTGLVEPEARSGAGAICGSDDSKLESGAAGRGADGTRLLAMLGGMARIAGWGIGADGSGFI